MVSIIFGTTKAQSVLRSKRLNAERGKVLDEGVIRMAQKAHGKHNRKGISLTKLFRMFPSNKAAEK